MLIKRGEIYLVNLNPVRGSEQAGHRPVVVFQNNVGNEFSPTTIVAPLTTKSFDKEYPTNVFVSKGVGNLKSDSTILLSQLRTIDKTRLEKKIGHLPDLLLQRVNAAIKISLAL